MAMSVVATLYCIAVYMVTICEGESHHFYLFFYLEKVNQNKTFVSGLSRLLVEVIISVYCK